MTARLRITFNSPQSGFMSIGLKFGRQRFLAAMSCRPYESLEELMRALTAVMSNAETALVRWNEDPEEFDFVLSAASDECKLEVIRYTSHLRRDGAPVFTAQGTREQICLPFWETLNAMKQDLVVDEFARNWRRAFPFREFAELEAAMGTTDC
ncbi:MAG: hypothetical protein ABIP75_14080 [Pyrinomonadaceae bacterium]